MGAALAPVIFLDPIRANCGCNPLRCEGHQPTPTHADRRQGYRQAADIIEAADDSEHVAALAQMLRACADLCIPAAHPSRPDPHTVIAALLGGADAVANAVLPEGDDDEDEDDGEEAEAGHA